ncbi:hypothetical protein [Endozoicomonas lisbonensis]|uniref:Uncharacterized protein n=2 Tax=Endozoicomonas lisbonensis TaxID=3120522 RepID=A0ABV2SNG1_9GAMM
MNLLKRIKGFVASLALLTICCLLLEQLGYLVLVPGYGWKLLSSPVLWSLFSVVCFSLLWRFDRKYPEDNSVPIDCEGWSPKRRINPATGLPMAGGIDSSGATYGGRPESGLMKSDNFWLISL